eukprot:jgi/Psemu1/22553/gm1.22553_g
MYKAKSIRSSPLQPRPTWDYWKRKREINAKAIQIASTPRDYDKHLERAGVKHFSFLCDSFCHRCNNANHLFYWINRQLICPQSKTKTAAESLVQKEERRGQQKQKATAKGKQYEVESAKKLGARRKDRKSMPKESAPSMGIDCFSPQLPTNLSQQRFDEDPPDASEGKGANNNATSTVEAKKSERSTMKSNKDNNNAFDSPAGDDGNLSGVASILGGKDHGDHDKSDDCKRNDDSGKPSEQDKRTELTPKNDSTKNLLKRKDHIQHTTTKLEGEKFGYLSIKDLFDGSSPVEKILSIDDNLKHNALKVWRQVKSNPIEKISLSLCDILMARDDYNALGRNPKTTKDPFLLHSGYTILDFATHWTFMKNSADISWCPLPTAFFEMLLSTHGCYGIYEKGNEIDRILNINPNIGGNLFDFDVIDYCVYSGNHFSQFFIFNAKSLKGYNKSKFMENDDSDHPFILYANSLPDCGWHLTDKVAEKFFKFLNKYGLEHDVFKVRACSKNTIPAIKIDVPVQSDTWTCGYQCLVACYHVMKKLQDGQKILLKDVEIGEINFCDGRKDSDSLLQEQKVRDQNNACERLEKFNGKMVDDDHKELTVAIKKASQFLDRRKGEPATSLEAYHDDAYHAALYHFSSRTKIYQAMCGYQSEHANRKLPKASSIAIIKNCACDPIRDEPQRLLITREQDRSKVKELVDDLYNNFENSKFVNDQNTIDVEIMGEDRPKTVMEFIQKRRCSKLTKADLEDNDEALKKSATALFLSPQPGVKENAPNEEDLGRGRLTWKGSLNVLPLDLTVEDIPTWKGAPNDSPTCAERLQRSLPQLEVLLLIPTGELEVTKGPTNPSNMWWNYAVPVKKTASMYKMGPPQVTDLLLTEPVSPTSHHGQVRTTKEGHRLDLRLLALSQRRQEPPTKSRTTNKDSTTEDFSRRITTSQRLVPATRTTNKVENHQQRLDHRRLLKEDYHSKWMLQRSSFSPPQSEWMLQPREEQKNYHRWLRDSFPQQFQEHTTVQASPSRELNENYHGDRIFPHPITPVRMDKFAKFQEHTTIQGPFLESSTGICKILGAHNYPGSLSRELNGNNYHGDRIPDR